MVMLNIQYSALYAGTDIQHVMMIGGDGDVDDLLGKTDSAMDQKDDNDDVDDWRRLGSGC